MPTKLIAADASTGAILDPSVGDGTLILQTGAAGAKVDAISIAADGTPTFLKAITLKPTNGLTGLTITSSQITPLVGPAVVMSYTHGLGLIPVSAEIEIVCLTAEAGFSVGDVVTPYTGGNVGYATPFSIKKTATVIEARAGSNQAFLVNHGTTGAATILTAANWAWRFKVRTT